MIMLKISQEIIIYSGVNKTHFLSFWRHSGTLQDKQQINVRFSIYLHEQRVQQAQVVENSDK